MGKFLSDACLDRAAMLDDAVHDALDDKATIEAVRGALKNGTTLDRVREVGLSFVINGYLSGTMTPIANAASVMLQSILRPMTYAIGSITDGLKITKGDRSLRDLGAIAEAMLEGWGADMQYLKAGWASGKPLDIRTEVTRIANAKNISAAEARRTIIDAASRAFAEKQIAKGSTQSPQELADVFKNAKRTSEETDKIIESFLGENYDYITNSIPNLGVINIPTKVSVAVDEYGKARFRRMKIAEMAARKARKEANEGKGRYADLYKQYQKDSLFGVDPEGTRYKDIQKSFSKLEENLAKVFGVDENDMLPYETVKEFALDNTFQSRLHGAVDKISKLRHGDSWTGAALTYFIPFMKTPWNIIKEGSTYIPVVPVVFRPKYLTKGEVVPMTRDELIPRQLLGGSMFLGVMSMYENGYATGNPKDAREAQEWKDKGIQPNSILIGDTWVQISRLEPIATVFGLAADLKKAWEEYNNDPRPPEDKDFVGETTLGILSSLKTNILQKSFMEGFATMFDMLSEPDKNYQTFVNTGLRPLTPALLNEVGRVIDDHERQSTTTGERLQQRIPFFREQLPVEYGAFGEARKTDVQQATTGFATKKESERTPLQRELEDLNVSISRPQKKLKSVELTNEQLAEYREISADFTTNYLNNVMNSQGYRVAPKSVRRRMMEKASSKAKTDARNRYFSILVRQDPEFARKFMNEEIIRQGAEDIVELKSPSQ
jgi:hypothetical protein